jgi:cell division protein FtsB
MRAKAGPWIPLAVVGVLLVCGWALYPALRLQYQASRRVATLEQQYDTLRKRNQSLKAQVAELKTPEGVAKAAAESLGFVKQGEHVYVVMGGKTPTSTLSAAASGASDRSALQVILDAVFGVEEAPTPDRAP